MPIAIQSLLSKTELKRHCAELSTAQLEAAHGHLLALIAERQQARDARELKRKGDRTLDDMRGLMAKAGISMSELQAALEGL